MPGVSLYRALDRTEALNRRDSDERGCTTPTPERVHLADT